MDYPKPQKYVSHVESFSVHQDKGFIALRRGEFIHIDTGVGAVEIKIDDSGNVGVCVSDGIPVKSFDEVYGGS